MPRGASDRSSSPDSGGSASAVSAGVLLKNACQKLNSQLNDRSFDALTVGGLDNAIMHAGQVKVGTVFRKIVYDDKTKTYSHSALLITEVSDDRYHGIKLHVNAEYSRWEELKKNPGILRHQSPNGIETDMTSENIEEWLNANGYKLAFSMG